MCFGSVERNDFQKDKRDLSKVRMAHANILWKTEMFIAFVFEGICTFAAQNPQAEHRVYTSDFVSVHYPQKGQTVQKGKGLEVGSTYEPIQKTCNTWNYWWPRHRLGTPPP